MEAASVTTSNECRLARIILYKGSSSNNGNILRSSKAIYYYLKPCSNVLNKIKTLTQGVPQRSLEAVHFAKEIFLRVWSQKNCLHLQRSLFPCHLHAMTVGSPRALELELLTTLFAFKMSSYP